jgi:sterol desaturase/sphingolipid hydroxylase (fatty acid hydroxylase superfamily)
MTAEAATRAFAFAGVLLVLLALESLRGVRARPAAGRSARAFRHLLLSVLGTLAARLILPLGLAGVAVWAEGAGVGLFNAEQAPSGVGFLVSLLALDLAVFLQHRAMHAAPLLWRLHRVHHSDVEMDVTTGLRFHPFEIALSLVWKACVIVALGVPVEAALAYEIMLNALSLFTHANIALPARVDRALRLFVATPAFHLVHHSPRRVETDSNFANALTIWDRLSGTWRDAAASPDPGLGLATLRDPEAQRLGALLAQPFGKVEDPARS